jgi:SAM-dependent methyltransferase
MQSHSVRCERCSISYPVEDGVADFVRGAYYDEFDETKQLTAEQIRAFDCEADGAVSRIRDYYLPLINAASPNGRILDAGCGNGMSVDLFARAGRNAWGIDSSRLRRWQWRNCEQREHLAVADGCQLPFPAGFFDVVLCSGVLEHVGVEESSGEKYEVKALPNRDDLRREFLRGLLRVLAPGGTLYLDFPNGAFPIDFWHNTLGGSARFHSTREGFLPTFAEVVALASTLPGPLAVSSLSPNRRLRFQQVRQHWYGRLFSLPMRLFFFLMDWFPRLSQSPINPFLVVAVSKVTAS